MLKFATLTSAAVLLAACASTPDVTYQYYLPTSLTTLTLTQTISCTKDKTALVVTSTPAVATAYMADTTAQKKLRVRDLDGSLADSDPAPAFSEDGRLKGFALTQTGQGSAIVKSLVTLVADVAKTGGGLGAQHAAAPKTEEIDECKYVDRYGNGNPITLIYTTQLNLAHPLPDPSNIRFFSEPGDKTDPQVNDHAAYAALKWKLPKILAHIDTSAEIQQADASCTADGSQIPLHLRKTVNVTVNFLVETAVMGTTSVTVPGDSAKESEYCIALPKAAAFGADKFTLTMTDSGAITALEYNKTNGTQDALSSADTALTTIAPLFAASSKPAPGAPPQPASITTVSQ